MSTTVDSIRRVKTGENVVFELIKKKIIEANPESENIKWDDFDILYYRAINGRSMFISGTCFKGRR